MTIIDTLFTALTEAINSPVQSSIENKKALTKDALEVFQKLFSSKPLTWGIGGSLGLSAYEILKRPLTYNDLDVICYDKNVFQVFKTLLKPNNNEGSDTKTKDNQYSGFLFKQRFKVCLFLNDTETNIDFIEALKPKYVDFLGGLYWFDSPLNAIKAKLNYIDNLLLNESTIGSFTGTHQSFIKHHQDVLDFYDKVIELKSRT